MYFGLLDCNNFFVSCERLFRPDLIGKPVVVLSGNDGCIVARSQEIKDMGIPMGVPYFQVKDILKKHETTCFSSHFALYRDVSRRVFAVMREELEVVQQYSVDEAFFQCDGPDASVALRVKKAVESRVGIPVSVGLAPTKTLAKYINSKAKKGVGVAVFDADNWEDEMKNIPLSAIWGVGGRMEMQYKKHTLVSVQDLVLADTERVKILFGVHGVRLQKELSGIPMYSLGEQAEPQKSIMSSRSFKARTTELSVLADAVAYHVRHAMVDLRAMNQKTQCLRVSIRPSRHGDFVLRGGSAEVIFAAPTDDTFRVLEEAQKLTKSLYEAGVPYKKVGIVLSHFSASQATQPALFATEAHDIKTNELMPIIDMLNKKLRKDSVVIGSRLHGAKWQARIDARSPAYTTQWKDIQTVKA